VVDARAREFREHRFGIAAVGPHAVLHLAMIGEGEQGLLGHGIDRVGRRQRFDVEDVRRGGILRTGARPEQALREGARGGQLLRAR
jgi:hypothetical protein